MKIWRKAAGALKDKNSIWLLSLSRKTPSRNPDLEAVIIRATSHDEFFLDYRNVHRVYTWVRTSHLNLKPFMFALSRRMEKTRSWAVAIKGLILLHGFFCCKIPAVYGIGRLPFDLSQFNDMHSDVSKTWGLNAFVRSYYAFLDQKSAFLYEQKNKRIEEPMAHELIKLQKLQSLLDMLLQIRPRSENMKVVLICEAMDCLIIETYDVYSKICNGIAWVLTRIFSAGTREAAIALEVIRKEAKQGQELSLYFEFCREFGVLNATGQSPVVRKIPEEDIRDIERFVIDPVRVKKSTDKVIPGRDTDSNRAMVVKEIGGVAKQRESKSLFKTIITDKWEVFDEESKVNEVIEPCLDLVPYCGAVQNKDIPDLITF